MLARKQRLSAKGISIIMRKGKRIQSAFFTVVCAPKYGKEATFTVIISNKVVKTAPKRARIKRRLRSMIREVFIKKSKYDCVFIARSNVEKSEWSDLVQAGQKCFDSLHHIST